MASILTDITQVVGQVVRDLRSVGPDTDLPRLKSLLSRAVFYLTSLRNEHNVPLLATEIVLSAGYLPNLENAQAVSEGFRAAVARKFTISDPTIPPDEWTAYLLAPVYDQLSKSGAAWRTLPILSGVIQACEFQTLQRATVPAHYEHFMPSRQQTRLAQDLFVGICNQVLLLPDAYADIKSMTILLIARTQWALDDATFNKLPHGALLRQAVELNYRPPHGIGFKSLGSISESPLFPSLNGFSLVTKRILESHSRQLTFSDIDESLIPLTAFTHWLANQWLVEHRAQGPLAAVRINTESEQWTTLKTVLFSVCIQLQGFSSVLLHVRRPEVHSLPYLASKIIRTLSPLFFLIHQLGSVGFEPFNFAYGVCLDALVERGTPRTTDELLWFLAGSCNLAATTENAVDRGKAIFLLDLFEGVIACCSSSTVETLVLPITRQFVSPVVADTDPTAALVQPVLESAHSVMLSYLALVSAGARKPDSSLVIGYFDAVVHLFPVNLSPVQFTLALETVATAVTPGPLRTWFLDTLYVKCKTALPGVPLPRSAKDVEEGPPTVRAVLVSAMIHVLPKLAPRDFAAWLPRVGDLYAHHGPYVSPSHQAENEFLQLDMERMVSGELDLALADIGIRWWHESRL